MNFFDADNNKFAESFPATKDFNALLRLVATTPGFRVEGYAGAFLAVYQVIRSWHGDWRYDLKITSDGRFILTSQGETTQPTHHISQP